MQQIICGKPLDVVLGEIMKRHGTTRYLLVCGSSLSFQGLESELDTLPAERVIFNGFTSNPRYEDVCKGVALFRKEGCDTIIAIGGGSSIDVAKCIKLFSGMDPSQSYLSQPYTDSMVPLIAVPTTAGTGSESTHFAVIYSEEKKLSVTHESMLPDYAILNAKLLRTLPLYQKKCTLLDALCQGIESWWSINSTLESKSYAKHAIEMIMKYKDEYLNDNDLAAAEKLLLAANYAGRAINLTQTTAAHAMSYKLTSLFGLPHGNAVAVCLPHIWRYMIEHREYCIDPRGPAALIKTFNDIAGALGAVGSENGADAFTRILKDLNMIKPEAADQALIDVCTASVNQERMKNNPVYLDKAAIYSLYEKIIVIRG